MSQLTGQRFAEIVAIGHGSLFPEVRIFESRSKRTAPVYAILLRELEGRIARSKKPLCAFMVLRNEAYRA